MLDIQINYSMKIRPCGLSEFNERRLKTWYEFKDIIENNNKLDELPRTLRNAHDIKDDNENIKKMLLKGDKIQPLLLKTSKDFDDYTTYYKSMLLNIAIQDDIRQQILDYIDFAYNMYTQSSNKASKLSERIDRNIVKNRKE